MNDAEDLMKKLYEEHQLNDQTNPTHCTCGHHYTEGGRMAQVINHHIIMAAAIGWQDGHDTALLNGQSENPHKENK